MNSMMKFIFLFILSAFTFTSYATNKIETDCSLLLSNNWLVQSSNIIKEKGQELSTNKIKKNSWYQANMPTTVMGVLTANGEYKNVLISTNYNYIDRFRFDNSWWFRKEFDFRELKDDEYASLSFDGISYSANVWLNGSLVISKDKLYGSFRQFKLDITPYLKKKNILAVEVFRALPGDLNIGFADWIPRPADENMGIFREVHLNVTGNVEMTNVHVQSKLNKETWNEAWLTVEAQVTNKSKEAINGFLVGKIEKDTFSMPVSLNAGETRIVKINSENAHVLHIKNPRLWWCNNLGSPEMYKMSLSFKLDGKESDSKTINFGIRDIEDYFTENGHRGFMLNGKKVLIKSAGWTDDIFLRNTSGRDEIQIQYVKDMNLNSIRCENIWGTSQNIYDMCDKYGIMVLVGWSCHWEWKEYLGTPCDKFGGVKSEEDMDLISQYFKDQVLWLRNHPSIIAWYVGSDMIPRPELEKKYLSFFSQIDNRPYIASAKSLLSEITGATGMKMAGPYEYVAPDYWYVDKKNGGAFGFNTETGIGAQLPVIESIRKIIPADKMWPVNDEWCYHCTASTSGMNTLSELTRAINEKYGEAKDLNDYLKKADLINYEGTKAMFESFRANIPETTGIVHWMLNSAWPSFYWQLYDYFMIPNAAYYSVKKSNFPQQLIYNYKEKSVYAVNEALENKNLIAKIRVLTMDSKVIEEKEIRLNMPAGVSEKIEELEPFTENVFLSLQLLNGKNQMLTDNFYCLSPKENTYSWDKTSWINTPIKEHDDFKPLSNIAQTTFKLDTKLSKVTDNYELVINVENQDEKVGFFTRFVLKDAKGEVLYPVCWSDNYISLLPGEKRVLKCAIPARVKNGKKIKLIVAGWNVLEKEMIIAE